MSQVDKIYKLESDLKSNGWEIAKNSFYDLDLTYPLDKSQLTEDLFQAVKNRFLIDIGWYNSLNYDEGGFIIYIIQDYNWDIPLIKVESYNIYLLLDLVNHLLINNFYIIESYRERPLLPPASG